MRPLLAAWRQYETLMDRVGRRRSRLRDADIRRAPPPGICRALDRGVQRHGREDEYRTRANNGAHDLNPRPTESHRHEQTAARRSAEIIADLMDNAIRVPGTAFRLGLDPLLGLIPGIGDAIASVIGACILFL